ncbi:MAG: hypothetical protein WKF47_18450 [Geodermatophilaceae bacterium]
MSGPRTRVHLLRHGEVDNPGASSTAGCPTTTCPRTVAGWPSGWPGGSGDTTSPIW